MINVQDIRKGMIYKMDGDLWTVMSMQHVTPGKGAAFVKVRARSHKTGNSKEINFRSGEKIEDIQVFEKDATYLYKEGEQYVFMDEETYEQYHVAPDLCEDVEKFVVLNGKVTLSIHDGNVLSVSAPNFVTLKVVKSEPGIKGDTATKATKSVELETGFEILVPLFINEDDVLKIDTRTAEYLERVKV
ncbi:MAG TPA: elongation factor P [Spirochaetota bacterium]|jgi:elongation factor P|nr:MAG: Elongation factor P [Spirochaetes bacterium ADurb.Bin133]HPY87837.1 elongation factor P [Spirochaetota bacterium]